MALDNAIGRWVLPADAGSAAVGRDLIGAAVEDVNTVDDIILATSELVTNAVKHGAGPVELRLIRIDTGLRVEVASRHAGREPALRRATHDDTGGRGLALVATLASRWGWERDADRLVVWAEFHRS